MNICPYCGNENADDASSCAVCGSQLTPQTPTGGAKKRRGGGGGKSGLIQKIILGVVAVGVVAGAAFGGVSLLSPTARLNHSVKKTWNAAVKTAQQQDDLKNFTDTLENIMKKKRVSLELERKSGDDVIGLQMDYSKQAKAANGAVSYNAGGRGGTVLFSYRHGVLQAQIPSITPEVYGLNLKKAGNSAALQFAQKVLNIDASKIVSKNIDRVLDGYTTSISDTWKQFMKLAKVEAMSKQGDLRVYRVTWSAKDLAAMAAGKQAKTLSGKLMELLEKVDGGCTCYVGRGGYLTKIEAVVGADLYTVSFSDADNPWREITVSSSMGGAVLLRGGLTADGDRFRAFLGGDQKGSVLELNYDRGTGAFSLQSGQTALSGVLRSTKNTSTLQFTDSNGVVLTIGLGRLQSAPKMLTHKYIDIQKITIGEISSLAIKAASSSEKIQQGWNAISGFLQSVTAK